MNPCKKLTIACVLLLTSFLANAQDISNDSVAIPSPSKNIVVTLRHKVTGEFSYEVSYRGRPAVGRSGLGLKLSRPVTDLTQFDITAVDVNNHDSTWKTVWGEQSQIRDHYNEVILHLRTKKDSIAVNLCFKVFDDGIGFRYEFPKQKNLNHFIISDEVSEFKMLGDHKVFYIPGDYDTNEYAYYTSTLSQIDATGGGKAEQISGKAFFDTNAVQTPLMMKSTEGLYINIHEAALTNYPAMTLVIDKATNTFISHLVPDAVGNKAYLQAPAKTPWRTIVISNKATEILASRMILNLNEPSVIADPSWIRPGKFVGVWWEMHVNKSSWDYSGQQAGAETDRKIPHGATTANVKKYIDFASKNGIGSVLVEGWNIGWEDWAGNWKEDVFDFVTPYPDYDVNELTRYGKEKNVQIIAHHETSGSATNYERWMDTAYRFMVNHNMNSLKSGYVGRIIPRGEHHDGQWMVKHYARAITKAIPYHIMVDAHEPVRPTGLHRTYPNFMACEAARGNEFNAWSTGNQPDHETILPFTRLMGGPMDYTPGIFQLKLTYYDTANHHQVHTTLAKQLALYVTMYSPLQMAADLPENYEAKMDAFQFIKDVAVDWDDTKILDAEPGDYVIIARKAKNTENWFLGAITDEQARNFTTPLDFLGSQKYIATIYHDGKNADWDKNPESYEINQFIVDGNTRLKLALAPGGGTAISFMPATAEQLKRVKKYK